MKLLLVLSILVGYEAFQSVEEYYWRDYKGLIPLDAIVGGSDESGETTYIVQFATLSVYEHDVSNIDVVIGTLNAGDERAVAAYNGRAIYSNETSNVKVLCTSNKNRYDWKKKKSLFTTSCRYVIGGIEDGIPLFIGKAPHGKSKVIGKVFSDTSYHPNKLVVAHNGGEITFDAYEMLTFCM